MENPVVNERAEHPTLKPHKNRSKICVGCNCTLYNDYKEVDRKVAISMATDSGEGHATFMERLEKREELLNAKKSKSSQQALTRSDSVRDPMMLMSIQFNDFHDS